MIILAIINVVDSITAAAVTPTLSFYVTELGGSKEQYGLVMSAGSLAALFMMSVYGMWVDSNGNKYRAPYTATFAFGITGQLIYFLSILLPSNIAVYGLMVGKFINGLGTAGRTLSYSYIATAIPHNEQRKLLSVMTMTKTGGMILGPLVNLLVSEIDTEITLFGGRLIIPLNPYNTVGLIIAGGEILLLIVMLFFLEEPIPVNNQKKNSKKDQRKSIVSVSSSDESATVRTPTLQIVKSILSFEIVFPLFLMTVGMASFRLPFVALAPVSAHALGWGPVETSSVFSMLSIVITGGMALVLYLSSLNIPDVVMLTTGNLFIGISGYLIYQLWDDQSANWITFSFPVWFLCFGYPFIGPANRASFTMAVHSKPELAGMHGVMQSMLTQAMSLAGLVAPTLIATYVMRDPDDIDSSSDKHELSIWALYIPVLSGLCIIGSFYQYFVLDKKKEEEEENDEQRVSETSTLLSDADFRHRKSGSMTLHDVDECLSRNTEVFRRMSVEIEGITNPMETNFEVVLKDKLWKQKEELEESAALE